ncbi:MAG: hypothetical protein LW627_04940 [Ilumatobacteraceae bacterium]|jgi:hypothetical protein|nr:hypothetical protein [Ilumatobacteraceae bacterium]
MNTPEKSARIDDWASRLIDDDIVLDDIDPTSRDAVMERAEQFRVMRDALRRTRDDTPANTSAVVTRVLATSPRHRRVGPYVASLAAAAVVATIVGVAVSSTGDSREPSTVAENATQTKIAADEPAPATEAPAAGQAPTAMDFSVGDACPDDLRPTIIPLAYIDNEAVEIHWSAVNGVVVYRISDCSVVLATTP